MLCRLGALALAGSLSFAAMPGAALAQGAVGLLKGTEDRNFGRMLFTLPAAQRVTARIANGILVVSFSEPVTIPADRIVREMPSYVSVARMDPDGRGMRFALTRPLTPNVLDAGERVFVDLIPPNWQGMRPGLPPEVVEEMVDRLRKAEMAAREMVRSREQAEVTELELRAATLPTLSRLIFDVPPAMNVQVDAKDDRLDLLFRAPVTLSTARLRASLPEGARIEAIANERGVLRVSLSLDPSIEAKTFREDDGFIVDLVNKARAAEAARAAEIELAKAAAAAPDAEKPAAPAGVQPAGPGPARAGTPANAPARPAELAAAPAPAPAAAPAAPAAPPQAVRFEVSNVDGGARIDFSFPRRTAAAGFDDRGELVLVFDTIDTIDAKELAAKAAALLESASATKEGKATVLRLQLKQPGLVRLAPDGLRWSLTLGDKGVQAAEPLLAKRGFDESGHSIVSLPLANVSGVHWLGAEIGQAVAVATAHGPGASTPKAQRFVEFQIEQTMQGVVVRPYADDVVVRSNIGEVVIGRSGGLVVSANGEKVAPVDSSGEKLKLMAEHADWREKQTGDPHLRLQDLTRKAAQAPRSERSEARLKLAAFQLAHGLHAESLGPVASIIADDPTMRNDRRPHLFRAIAQTMMNRTAAAEQTLAAPFLKDDVEAQLWRAVNDARGGRFPRALAAFRRLPEIVDAYPEALQALVRREIVNAAIAMRDAGVAEQELAILAQLAPEWIVRDEVELLRAQLDEISGRPEAAMVAYKALFDSSHRPVAARAQLKGVRLSDREKDGVIPPEEARVRLETVSFTWRGDDVEIEAIGELGAIYAQRQMWREAFALARRANGVFPDHPITRKLHDDTAQQFEELFTTGKAEQLPRIDALALFYDFKEFMPIGRRGDEIIRRLADRLVEVDLLDQAAEILQHQIDNRLNGAARATVAARLAMIRLMNNKPAEALRALSSTRLPELPRDVKRARQLLEAKALSDLSRTDLALEVLENEQGPEIDRLRADILWTARRWREAGEAHERILGDAWRASKGLDDRQRADAMRAAVAYVMANEALSLDRLRAKYANPMSQTPDARTFAFVTGANRASSGDLRELARSVANADTLMEFMSEYRKRYPDYASSLRTRQVKPETPAGQTVAPADPSAPAPEAAAPPPAAEAAPRQG